MSTHSALEPNPSHQLRFMLGHFFENEPANTGNESRRSFFPALLPAPDELFTESLTLDVANDPRVTSIVQDRLEITQKLHPSVEEAYAEDLRKRRSTNPDSDSLVTYLLGEIRIVRTSRYILQNAVHREPQNVGWSAMTNTYNLELEIDSVGAADYIVTRDIVRTDAQLHDNTLRRPNRQELETDGIVFDKETSILSGYLLDHVMRVELPKPIADLSIEAFLNKR